jgi:hypothetical protein
VTVVTASADSPDTHGYCDRAIGWSAGAFDRVEEAVTIAAYWFNQKGRSQERWEYLFDEGAFPLAVVQTLADAVWPGDADASQADDRE